MIEISQEVQYLLNRLEQNGYEAYLVGGCVRDALLGRVPQDWDLCTSASPAQTAACFLDQRISLAGFRHGTVGVLLGGHPYEITTYRAEKGYTDGRHPDKVNFVSDLKQDLARRDFTVNAMAYHPRRGLVDPWRGQADLEQGLLRCVGDPFLRFSEDALRILRGMRFASTYSFEIEENTARAAVHCRRRLEQISAERVQAELSRFLTGSMAGQVLSRFWPVFAAVLPECGEDPVVWEQTAARLSRAKADLTVRLAVLLSGVPQGVAALERLRFGKKLSEDVRTLVAKAKGHPFTDITAKQLLREMGEPMARCWVDYRFAMDGEENRYREWRLTLERTLREGQCYSLRQLAIGGRELMSLGYTGPQVGACLEHLLDRVIRGKTENTAPALLEQANRQKSGGSTISSQ
ncbi:MAG: CCA tRNA nucleotidyltransferase [Oscillospiraceae bacterium]|nr:CCA tRNA nucleotidyltransferase [Oscillospiraceae bacterium]